jgi:protocatechuate 3,4-dioxygenase, beta subunit
MNLGDALPNTNIILPMKPTPFQIYIPRRHFLRQLAFGSALFAVPGLFAEQLALTPPQTEGPFYPDTLPLDTDNDLIIVNDRLTPAVGTITWLSGRILTRNGSPVRNATVEIWQCDSTGVYLHTKTGGDKAKRDSNFQCFGRFVTGETGEYVFRTIKPVPYPGRTPHIHLAVKLKGKKDLVSQCYIKGYAGNEQDMIWKQLAAAKQESLVTIDFAPLSGSTANELTAKWDVVLGVTPEHV